MSLLEFRHARRLVGLAIGLYFVAHLYHLSLPPNGYHHWRESDTAAVILNYHQESMNFFEPRVNQRGTTSGVAGMELPLYNYAAALVYTVTGPSHAAARTLTLLAACLGLWIFFRLTSLMVHQKVAALATWALAFSPLYFFYGFKIMPDIWSLTLWLASIWLYVRFLRGGRRLTWFASATCLALAACIKPLGLAVYLPYLFWMWRRNRKRLPDLALFGTYVAVTLGPVVAWFTYARWLEYVHAVKAFYLGESLTNFHEFLFTELFFKKLFLQWPAELWVGWVLLPAFCYGCYHIWKTRGRGLLLVSLLAAYIVFVITARHSCSHDYYTLIIVPLLALVTGIGLHRLGIAGGWRAGVGLVLLLLALPAAFIRVHHRFGPTQDYYAIRATVSEVIPSSSLVAVEDRSNAIRLYQLNRKGWPLLAGPLFDEVSQRFEDGTGFLIVNHPLPTTDSHWQDVLDTAAIPLGPLYAYRAKD